MLNYSKTQHKGSKLVRRFVPKKLISGTFLERPKVAVGNITQDIVTPEPKVKITPKETPADCLKKHQRYFIYKDKPFRIFSLRALDYQQRMDIVKEARELEQDFNYFDCTRENYEYTPQAYLRTDIPNEEESFELLHLPQNSPKWQFLRRYFVGASEAAAILGMNSYGALHTYHLTKLGVFGFENQVKLEFSIGHLFEDLVGGCLVRVMRECLKIPDFGTEDIGVLTSRAGTWASIDKIVTGEGIIPWSTIRRWDPTWHCGWKLTQEELDAGGIPLGQMIAELKTGTNYTIVTHIEKIIRPAQEHSIQVQEQLRAAGLQKNPYYSNRKYALICQLKPPFKDHVKEHESMSTVIWGSETPSEIGELMGTDYWRAITERYGRPWVLNLWLTRKNEEFLEASAKRVDYFMEQHHNINLSFYDYPLDLPEPDLPRCIYMGSYAFQGREEDIPINFVKGKEVEGMVNEAPLAHELALLEETKDGKMYLPRPGSLAMKFSETHESKINYYTMVEPKPIPKWK